MKSFLSGLLVKDPKRRLNWPHLLHHPYVAQDGLSTSKNNTRKFRGRLETFMGKVEEDRVERRRIREEGGEKENVVDHKTSPDSSSRKKASKKGTSLIYDNNDENDNENRWGVGGRGGGAKRRPRAATAQ